MTEHSAPPTAATPWLNVSESAAYARTGKRIIYAGIRSGALRHVRVGGRREVRIRAEWLDRWLEGQEPARG